VREGGEASAVPLDISVLHNMRQFVKYSRFKQFALRVSWYERVVWNIGHDSGRCDTNDFLQHYRH
jgi:hypothetical protein